MKHKEKGINISHVNIENMGGRDQSQVKIEFKKFEKKVSPFRINVPKSHNDDKSELCFIRGKEDWDDCCTRLFFLQCNLCDKINSYPRWKC